VILVEEAAGALVFAAGAVLRGAIAIVIELRFGGWE